MAKILIVDDEKSIRRTLSEFLRADGYEVTEAAEAEAALEQLQAAEFDVVVTDIIMPRVTGVELLRRIHNTAPHVQVVMMTGEPTVETAAASLRAGAADYLFKPITKDAILRVVGNAMKLKTLTDAKRRLEAENRAHQENLERLVEARTQKLRASEEQAHELSRFNRAILDALFAHICVLAEDGTILAVNRNWQDFATANPLLGVSVGVGANFLAHHEAATGEATATAREVVQGLRAMVKSDLPEFEMEYPCRSPGGPLWFMLRATRFAGTGPLRLVVVFVNITERRRAEERLREQAQLIDLARDAIIVADLEGKPSFANPAAERLSGWKLEDWRDRSLRALFAAPADYDASMAHFRQHGDFSGDVRLVTKNGQDLYVHSRWTLLRDSAGNPKGVLSINTDITEKKALEKQFLRAQRLESLGQLAGGIAHDLNNVLAPILMSLEILREKYAESDDLAVIRNLETSAKRGAGIVKQVLIFARGVQGEKGPLQLRHLIKEMAHLIKETFPRSITLQTRVGTDLWVVSGDANHLYQVLMNLCVNARDAMPQGGKMTLAAENVSLDEMAARQMPHAKPGPYVVMRVADTGMGIPPENRDRIFEPFFTTKGPEQGTGLGLSTVLGIVKSHGGFIQVESKPGQGSEFKVYLPALPGQAEAAPSGGAPAIPKAQGELILLVEDEESVRSVTRSVLEKNGYRVLTARDGADGLALYAVNRAEVKLVLTDMAMPIMSGEAMIKVLKRLNPALKIIVVSGQNVGSGAIDPAQSGVQAFLPKPYTADTLLATVQEVLQCEGGKS
ncbi:MAG: PAS domain-containing hybrid sensor histidine kinase/response regulator [Limisphaerales bacterium]